MTVLSNQAARATMLLQQGRRDITADLYAEVSDGPPHGVSSSRIE
jgi:hypothetical protein